MGDVRMRGEARQTPPLFSFAFPSHSPSLFSLCLPLFSPLHYCMNRVVQKKTQEERKKQPGKKKENTVKAILFCLIDLL